MKVTNTIISINLGNFGSTGNIAREIGELYMLKTGNKYFYAYPWDKNNVKKKENDIVIVGKFFRSIQKIIGYYFGRLNTGLIIHTAIFLHKIKKINPAIIHLHNIHNNFLNHKMLFSFIKKNNYKVIWTLHDCWSFTGQCAHFDYIKCDKWKNGCSSCPQYNLVYPKTHIDKTKDSWLSKKKMFTDLKNVTIVTPSCWLSDLVKESFLNKYSIEIINNGIDTLIFKPIENNFRIKNSLTNKFIVLGVAYEWCQRKGIDIFIRLAKELNNDFAIVLVGTIDKKSYNLPSNIILIDKTNNQKELAMLYSSSDVFVNASREENYPTVNMEALCCGTPVITFNSGGSGEMINNKCGHIIEKDNFDKMKEKIIELKENYYINRSECLIKAREFNKNDKYFEYLKLYNKIINQ